MRNVNPSPPVQLVWFKRDLRIRDQAPLTEAALHVPAIKEARAKLGAVRRTPFERAEAERVYAKHGSRKRPRSKKSAKKKSAEKQQPMQLEFGAKP